MVESCDQTPSLGIDGTIQTVDGNEFLEEVLDSSSVHENQLIVFNIRLKGNKGEELIKQIRDKPSKVCIFLTTEEYEFLNNDRLLARINPIHLNNNLINSHVKGFSLITNDGKPVNHEEKKVKLTSKKPSPNLEFTKPLTNREIEIMNLLSKGLLYKEIAKIMRISVQTVKSHLKHIYPKLKVNNRTEAILRYLRAT